MPPPPNYTWREIEFNVPALHRYRKEGLPLSGEAIAALALQALPFFVCSDCRSVLTPQAVENEQTYCTQCEERRSIPPTVTVTPSRQDAAVPWSIAVEPCGLCSGTGRGALNQPHGPCRGTGRIRYRRKAQPPAPPPPSVWDRLIAPTPPERTAEEASKVSKLIHSFGYPVRNCRCSVCSEKVKAPPTLWERLLAEEPAT